jgi:hypothetical protein
MEIYCIKCIYRKCATCDYYNEIDEDCNYIYDDSKECVCVGCYHGCNKKEVKEN